MCFTNQYFALSPSSHIFVYLYADWLINSNCEELSKALYVYENSIFIWGKHFLQFFKREISGGFKIFFNFNLLSHFWNFTTHKQFVCEIYNIFELHKFWILQHFIIPQQATMLQPSTGVYSQEILTWSFFGENIELWQKYTPILYYFFESGLARVHWI